MKITGKCKEEFKIYLHRNFGADCDVMTGNDTAFLCGVYHDFIKLPNSFKWGVYQDYFISIGIFIHCPRILGGYQGVLNGEIVCKTLEIRESREKAIEKANESRNKQLD